MQNGMAAARARMSVGKPDRNSIRPQVHSSECSGLGVEVGYGVQAEKTQEKAVLSFEDDTKRLLSRSKHHCFLTRLGGGPLICVSHSASRPVVGS